MLAALASLLWTMPAARASDLPSPFLSGNFEAWSGGEGVRRAWSAYSGFTWAPSGTLAESGLRLRATGGYGQYSYDGVVDYTRRSIYGTTLFADLLVGYQLNLGKLTLKGFAGASHDGHYLEPLDPSNRISGSAIGAKLALEAWYNFDDKAWAQTDVSWSSAHGTYGGRARVGYRVHQGFMEDVSVGLEAGAFGNDAGDNARGGVFVRYAWFGGELSASAGVSGDVPSKGMSFSRLSNPYGTLVYLTRY
jgi:hypothetical protein